MHTTIDQVEFTIFDTETTGLDPAGGDRIVEIAAVRLRGQAVVAQFNSLVNPGRPVSDAAYQVNKISDEMLVGAPFMPELIPAFLDFIKGSCLCSYNMPFDLGFLEQELQLAGVHVSADIACVDILAMARRLLPRLERHALWFVAQSLGIDVVQEHRAMKDVHMTVRVFNVLRDMLRQKGIMDYRSFKGLFGVTGRIAEDANQWKIAEIQQAIDTQTKLKIVYFSRKDSGISEREVVPKQIRQDKFSRYLIGYCCMRNDERMFRIDGILHVAPALGGDCEKKN